MALLDPIALCQAVLETIMTQEIVLANRSDSALGTGTATDPFNAGGSPQTNATTDLPFDLIMRTVLATGQAKTVRLLPGNYYTRGFPSATPGLGWRPGSGLRLVGSGPTKTFLLRTGTPAVNQNAVIGNDYTNASQFIDGLEVSNLSLDAAFVYASSGGSVMSGVAVYGKNILLQNLRVFNIGNNLGTTEACFGISAARVSAPATPVHTNCVVSKCVVNSPGVNATGPLFGIHLSSESEGKYHQFCTVRDCFVDLNNFPADPVSYAGIAVGGGIGTIVEYNRFVNSNYGLILPNLISTSDLIIKHNYFRLPTKGIELNMTGAAIGVTMGRAFLFNNVIEWFDSTYTSPVNGILVAGGGGTKFNRVLLRNNVIRRFDNSGNTRDKGIIVDSAAQTVVDNNIIDVANVDNGVQVASSGVAIKPLNNIKADGTLLQAFTTDTAVKLPELATMLRDVDIALFRQ